MNIERLVEMANDIAANQAADRPSAVVLIAQHLRRFWEPRMRKQIIDHLHNGGAGLGDEARAAVALLADPIHNQK